MSLTNEEIRGQFLEETHRWDETILARCLTPEGRPFTLKAKAERDELVGGLTYCFYGRWTTHYQYGRQFLAKTFAKVTPHEERGVIAYLVRAPNVGPATAKKLWALYQGEAIRRLREDPAAVAEAVGSRQFKPDRAKEAAEYLEQERALEDATVRLMNLLAGKGMPRDTIKRAIKKWGNCAAEIVERNPYHLMRFPGCGFLRTDELYLERGGNPARLKRQTLCAWYDLSRDGSGSTWFEPAMLEAGLKERIGSARVRALDAMKLGKRAGIFSVRRDDANRPWITDRVRAEAERVAAERVHHLRSRAVAWPDVADLDVSPHQREQLAKSLAGPVGLFCGGPGSGKTYTAARLIQRLTTVHGSGEVAVVAPTGKAAVRVSEAMQAYGLNLKATTIHRLLGVAEAGDEGFRFEHNEDNPVEPRFVICDEASMVDVSLLAALTSAMRDDGHLLLVGDLEQLPPVGHGAPLRDLIGAKLPIGGLTEIRRNSGLIVEICAKIRDEELFDFPDALDVEAGQNLMLRRSPNAETTLEHMLTLVRKIRDLGLADPVWETQLIVAVNEKSPLGRKELNRLLQAELNGSNRQREGRFWPCDKVVCLKNSFFPAVREAMDSVEQDDEGADDPLVRQKESGVELYVANGEQGRMVEIFPNRLIVEFATPRRVVLIPLGEGQPPIDLAYAISGHKSQGSEWPIVIVALDDYGGAKMVCDRGWAYTAISRAKRACILVGQEETFRSMCRRQKIHARKTFLVERLEDLWSEGVSHGGDRQHETREPGLNGAPAGAVHDPERWKGESELPVPGIAV